MTVAERGELLVTAGLFGGQVAPRESEWIGLVAVAGGAFLRSQYEAWAGVDRRRARDLVKRISEARLGTEVDGGRGIGRYIQLGSKRLYRALGMGDSRHRRRGSTGHLLQRLLALDHVIARGGDPGWLFGVDDQCGGFRGLGAPDGALPQRTYRAKDGGDPTVSYFPARWPVGLTEGAALFVLPDSGETARPELELRTWGRHHARLWDWLRRRQLAVEVVFACRTDSRERAVRKELQRWVDSGVPPKGGPAGGEDPAAEVERINAMLADKRVKELVERYGSINACLRRRRVLSETPGAQPRARVRSAGTWLSGRLQARALAPGVPLTDADFDVVPVPAEIVGA